MIDSSTDQPFETVAPRVVSPHLEPDDLGVAPLVNDPQESLRALDPDISLQSHGSSPQLNTPTAVASARRPSEKAEVDAMMDQIPGERRGPLHALSFRNFRLYFIGQLISVAGTWMQSVAQAWLIWDLTRSPIWLGYINGANAIPYVVFSIAGGNVADRYSRRTVLVWTQTLMMLLAFVLAALASRIGIHWGGSPHLTPIHPIVRPWHVALLTAIGGIVNAYNMPAQQAFVTDMVDRDALANAIALNAFRFNLARFIGPIFAGVVLMKSSPAMCFFLNGLSFIAVIVSLLMMRLPVFVPAGSRGSDWAGLTYIRKTPSTLRVVLLIGSAGIFAWSASTLFPMLATHFHSVNMRLSEKSAFSTIMAVNGVGAALGGAFLTVFGDRIKRKRLVYGGNVVLCLGLIALSLAGSYILALGCLLISGFAMIVFAISANIKVQEDAPDALRGRVMAIYSLVFQGLMPLGSLEIGYLASRRPANTAIRIDALLCLAVAFAMYIWSIRDRSETAPVAAPANA